jgi:plastocyanin
LAILSSPAAAVYYDYPAPVVSSSPGTNEPVTATQGKGGASAACVVWMSNDLRFIPYRIVIAAGESVEWENNSDFHQTVTCDPAAAKRKEDAALPPAAMPFDSGTIEPGRKFRYTFTVPGSYRYFSKTNEELGMAGEIQVRQSIKK